MILRALRKVLREPLYSLLLVVVSVSVFVLAVLFPNLSLIREVMAHPSLSIGDKVALPIGLLGSISTNFTLLSAIVTVAISVLFAANVALTTYFLRRRITQVKQSGAAHGVFGVVSAVVGIGCAACGSLLLSSLLALVGAGWVLAYLPLAGGEFGLIGVVLLVYALHATAKQILSPGVCAV